MSTADQTGYWSGFDCCLKQQHVASRVMTDGLARCLVVQLLAVQVLHVITTLMALMRGWQNSVMTDSAIWNDYDNIKRPKKTLIVSFMVKSYGCITYCSKGAGLHWLSGCLTWNRLRSPCTITHLIYTIGKREGHRLQGTLLSVSFAQELFASSTEIRTSVYQDKARLRSDRHQVQNVKKTFPEPFVKYW